MTQLWSVYQTVGVCCTGVWNRIWDHMGKSISGLHRTYYGIFRAGTKGRESDGPKWFGEEQVWENKGIRRSKDLDTFNSLLVTMIVCLCPAPVLCSLSHLLIDLLCNSFPRWSTLFSVCVRMCRYGVWVPATGLGTIWGAAQPQLEVAAWLKLERLEGVK